MLKTKRIKRKRRNTHQTIIKNHKVKFMRTYGSCFPIRKWYSCLIFKSYDVAHTNTLIFAMSIALKPSKSFATLLLYIRPLNRVIFFPLLFFFKIETIICIVFFSSFSSIDFDFEKYSWNIMMMIYFSKKSTIVVNFSFYTKSHILNKVKWSLVAKFYLELSTFKRCSRFTQQERIFYHNAIHWFLFKHMFNGLFSVNIDIGSIYRIIIKIHNSKMNVFAAKITACSKWNE